jgi:hypothetical protein
MFSNSSTSFEDNSAEAKDIGTPSIEKSDSSVGVSHTGRFHSCCHGADLVGMMD